MATGLEGVAALTAQLNELGVKFAMRTLKATVKTALQAAEHKARATMPVGHVPHYTYKGRLVSPGYAISTLHIETGLSKRTGAAYALLGVAPEAFYVVQFFERGTYKMPRYPWLSTAFTSTTGIQLESIRTELKERVDKAVRAKGRSSGAPLGTPGTRIQATVIGLP